MRPSVRCLAKGLSLHTLHTLTIRAFLENKYPLIASTLSYNVSVFSHSCTRVSFFSFFYPYWGLETAGFITAALLPSSGLNTMVQYCQINKHLLLQSYAVTKRDNIYVYKYNREILCKQFCSMSLKFKLSCKLFVIKCIEILQVSHWINMAWHYQHKQ